MAQQLHQASFFLFNNDSESRTPSVALVSGDVFLITADSHTRLLVLLLLMNMQHTFHRAYVLCLHSLCIQLQHIQSRGGSLCDRLCWAEVRGESFLSFAFWAPSAIERESCFDLTSVQLADAPFYVKYSILRPPFLPNPEPFRTLWYVHEFTLDITALGVQPFDKQV